MIKLFSVLLSLFTHVAFAQMADQCAWIAEQKVIGFTFQQLLEERYDDEGALTGLYVFGNKKLSDAELQKIADQDDDEFTEKSLEKLEKQPPSFNLLVMDNRVRQKSGLDKITAQKYMAGLGESCSIASYPCFMQKQGMMNMVAVGVDENITVVGMLVGGKKNLAEALKLVKELKFEGIKSGAKAQVVDKIQKKKSKGQSLDAKNIEEALKKMQNGGSVKDLKSLFGG